jgi:hypothetical protein
VITEYVILWLMSSNWPWLTKSQIASDKVLYIRRRLIVIIWLLSSVFSCPKVITLCNWQTAFNPFYFCKIVKFVPFCMLEFIQHKSGCSIDKNCFECLSCHVCFLIDNEISKSLLHKSITKLPRTNHLIKKKFQFCFTWNENFTVIYLPVASHLCFWICIRRCSSQFITMFCTR